MKSPIRLPLPTMLPLRRAPSRPVVLSLATALLAIASGCGGASPEEGADSSSAAIVSPIKPPTFQPLLPGCDAPKPITDLGYPGFRVYVDANGDSRTDYCRFVGDAPNVFLSCQLSCGSGGYGVSTGFNSSPGIDQGYAGSASLYDINDDGLADFCRLVGNPGSTFIACDMGYFHVTPPASGYGFPTMTPAGFDPNSLGVSLPPNTPMFSVALSPMPASAKQGDPVTFTMTVTNNLPYAEPGLALIKLVSTANPATTYTAMTTGGNLTVQAHSTLTTTVTIPAPAYGTYQATGAFEWSLRSQELMMGESAPQTFTSTPPPAPPVVTMDGTDETDGTWSPFGGMTITAGDTVYFKGSVTAGPYCKTASWRFYYHVDGEPDSHVATGTAPAQPGSSLTISPTEQGTAIIVATCDADTTLTSTAAVTVWTVPKVAPPTPPTPPTPPPPPPSADQVYTTTLQRGGGPANGGPLPYAGYVPGPGVYGKAQWLQNPIQNGGATISIVKIGATSDKCFDSSSSVTLAAGAKTTAADMTKLFGSATPALPLAVVACVYASGNPPPTLLLTSDYLLP